MTTSSPLKLQEPRIETLPNRRMIGIVERYDCQSPSGIPDQWLRFLPYLERISGRVSGDTFGVCFNFGEDGKFDYMTGLETKEGTVPFGLHELQLPGQKYAVFAYSGHVAEIRAVIDAIWNEALPASGLETEEGSTLERYGPNFDSTTGLGGFEIWVAIK